jgi:four helix bundle protein
VQLVPKLQRWLIMAAHYRELTIWQLCRDLRDRVAVLAATPTMSRDLGFCDQIRAAASSPCANIAEGFGRFSPKDFARFLKIARGSLNELEEHLDEAAARGLIAREQRAELAGTANHAVHAITRLIRYLETAREPGTRNPERGRARFDGER